MGTVLSETGVEAGGVNLATALLPEPSESLFEKPELPDEVFLRRIVHSQFKKAVALEYYPPVDKRTKKELVGEKLEKHTAQAVSNLDRMLEGHRPPTMKLLRCIRKKVPGAGVAIAHFYADLGGVERGAVKLDLVRLQELVQQLEQRAQRQDEDRAFIQSGMGAVKEVLAKVLAEARR